MTERDSATAQTPPNTKHEIRNPKQIQNEQIEMIKTMVKTQAFSSFENLYFRIRFGFRHSDFEF